jgi:hypothetical protein
MNSLIIFVIYRHIMENSCIQQNCKNTKVGAVINVLKLSLIQSHIRLRNFGPTTLALWKRSMDNKKTKYRHNYILRNEIHVKNSRLY